MTHFDFNELNLSEEPAAELLVALGWAFADSAELTADRDGDSDVLLTARVEAALRALNPWINDENVRLAVRHLRQLGATGLLEANERVHVALTHGISLEQDLGSGSRGQQVRFIDYGGGGVGRHQDRTSNIQRPTSNVQVSEETGNNEFLFTRQFRVTVGGRTAVCDIVCFVNGIPLAVIECKSPALREPLADGIRQLLRYQEAGDEWTGRGVPRLFNTVQLLIATCGQAARSAPVGTPGDRWAEWKVPYPMSLDQLQATLWRSHGRASSESTTYSQLAACDVSCAQMAGRIPTPQDVAIAGLLSPTNLLDMVRNFNVFETVQGRTVRKVCRYNQFVAVHEALKRIRKARQPERRGGVIWNTQGSGKSLTMLFLAVALRRLPEAENPLLVIVTDRTDLDDQISGTFGRCGFPNPVQAGSVRELRRLLSKGTGQTVLTTIHKFQDATDDDGLHPVLNEAENVFVFVDECHRTQFRSLAANMRRGLPNACFIGFTGTPIDKRDRSTFRTFGPYIHTYTIDQAVADGATVPIYYELRNSRDRIEGESLDVAFDRVFADRSEEERAAIKDRYATAEAIAGAPKRIERICEDLLAHYRQTIEPNGFKAQVVACSRRTAATYREFLGRLAGESRVALVVSFSPGDEEDIARWALGKSDIRKVINRFKNPDDPLHFLIVCDMLLTGFDAPVEQVMYLDAPLREHNLLQAIARVNRPARNKDYGLVVDYWGVGKELPKALSAFAPDEVAAAMIPRTDELPRLESRHRTAMRFFSGIDRTNLEQCLNVLVPEDIRAEFELAFQRFSRSMDMLLPDPAALPYMDDLRWLGKVRQAARLRFRDQTMDMTGCRPKVRKLIEEAISSEGVETLLEPVSILAPEFEERVAQLESDEARASEMEHAVRYEITVRMPENPAFYGSLKEKLEALITARRRESEDAATYLGNLQGLAETIRCAPANAATNLGLDETGYAIYESLGENEKVMSVAEESGGTYEVDTTRRDLTISILDSLQDLAIIDWVHKEDVQRRMRLTIKRQLRAAGYPVDSIAGMTDELMALARTHLR